MRIPFEVLDRIIEHDLSTTVFGVPENTGADRTEGQARKVFFFSNIAPLQSKLLYNRSDKLPGFPVFNRAGRPLFYGLQKLHISPYIKPAKTEHN